MTAPRVHHDANMDAPACTPAAIRAVLAAQAESGVLLAFDRDLDATFELARASGDLTSLIQAMRRWWFEAVTWRDPEARRRFDDRVNRYLTQGPPPPRERMGREELRARYGV